MTAKPEIDCQNCGFIQDHSGNKMGQFSYGHNIVLVTTCGSDIVSDHVFYIQVVVVRIQNFYFSPKKFSFKTFQYSFFGAEMIFSEA